MFYQLFFQAVSLLIVTGFLQSFSISFGTGATVEITDLPEYPTGSTLKGRVTGVDFATHHVAMYIHVEGRGWWTKPDFENSKIPINPNGEFVVEVITPGSDSDGYARIYDVQVLPNDVDPIDANGLKTLPVNPDPQAETFEYRNGRTLNFSGRTWAVKEAPFNTDPGNGHFSALLDDVFVDGDGLHLTITERDGEFWSSEVILTESLGYGTYTFHTNYRADLLDPNATFGAFTWDSFGGELRIPGAPLRELDIEDSRWGVANDPNNTQYVVQPHLVSGNRHRFSLPDLSENAELTRYITWLPGRVHFMTAHGYYFPGQIPAEKIIKQLTYVEDTSKNHLVPEPGRETFRFNLYPNRAILAGATPIGAIVTDFSYTLPGDFDYDGDVDGSDFLKWQRGESPSPFSTLDLADWEANYGSTADPVPAPATIPEPATSIVLLLGVAAMLLHRH